MTQDFMPKNEFQKLRERRLQEGTKPFLARGSSVTRCDSCQLSLEACLCHWRSSMPLSIDIVLLMHEQEILKPTNTGRLIADCFPANSFAFQWSRTEPEQPLLDLIHSPERQCFILFPGEDRHERQVYQSPSSEELQSLCQNGSFQRKTPTIILLDGTWKQARKMFLSKWLHTLPTLSLEPSALASYALRTAPKAHQLSTAEAGIMLLNAFKQETQANFLAKYFDVFNHHYSAMRDTKAPEINELHDRLNSLRKSID